MIAQGGDGGTTDIGFQCLSGMFERNDDVLYICYDNEGYMNTGVQRSSATPPAARTATTPALGPEPGNVFGTGKFVPKIAVAHDIPYVATATVADLHDLERKVIKAMSIHGARYIQISVPCPLGWGAASLRHDQAGAAGGRDAGCTRSSRPSTAASPMRARSAGRFRCATISCCRSATRICSATGWTIRASARLQASATPTSRNTACSTRASERSVRREWSPCMISPITLDVGTSLANHTGSWRTVRPEYVLGCRPATHACPAGEDIQGWLALRREPATTRRRGAR